MKSSYILSFLLIVTASTNAMTVFQLDLERTGSATQTDWTSWAIDTPAGSSIMTTTNGIDVTLSAGGNGGIFNSRGDGDGRLTLTGSSFNEVVRDVISARDGDGTANVTLSGLLGGTTYTLIGFHTDSGGNAGFAANTASDDDGATITPSLVSGATLDSVTNGATSGFASATPSATISDTDIISSSITFTATGSDVTLSFASDATVGFAPVPFSGLQLEAVPEPSTALFSVLGVLGFGLRRRR